MYKSKHLLALKGMSAAQIKYFLDEAVPMKVQISSPDKRTDILKGKSIVTIFYENSTRTQTSFVNAGKFLGATTTNMAVSSSSVQKGESYIDTLKTIESYATDLIVIRHSVTGAADIAARELKCCVVNGGDGAHEHPTQALYDMFTMREKFGALKGLKVTILGDIKFSRVARSNIWGLQTMGADVTVFAPATLLPVGIEQTGVKVASCKREALDGAHVIMGLRIQLERQDNGLFPSTGEYRSVYGVGVDDLRYADKSAILMHPAPVNRGVEFSSEAVDCKQSVIVEQMTNGLALRMAVLKILLGGGVA